MKKYLAAIMMVFSCVLFMALGTSKVQAASSPDYQTIGVESKTQKIGKYKFKRVENASGYAYTKITKASTGKTVYKLKGNNLNATMTNGTYVYYAKENGTTIYRLNIASKKVTKIKKFAKLDDIAYIYKSAIYIDYLNDEPSDRATIKLYNVKTKKLKTITNNAYEIEGKGCYLQYKIYDGVNEGKVYKRNCNNGKTVLVK